MKYPILLVTFCLFVATTAHSQDKGYIAIAIGPSIPIGDFASKDPNNDSAGLAATGAIFDISFVYLFGKNFGAAALIRGQANSPDTDVLAQELSAKLPANVRYDIDTGTWTVGGGFIGGYGSFPISKKLSFESKIMIGSITASSPTIDIYLTNGIDAEWVKQESITSSAFAYLFGVGFKFNAGRRFCLLANVDYMASKPEFKNVEIISSDGGIDLNTWRQPFTTINIGLGIGYRI